MDVFVWINPVFLWIKFPDFYKQFYLPSRAGLWANWKSGVCITTLKAQYNLHLWNMLRLLRDLFSSLPKRGILSHPGFLSSMCNSVAKWQPKQIIGSQINRNLYSVLLCNYTFHSLTWEMIFRFCTPTPLSPLHKSVVLGDWPKS